jgi:hypothetical protein
MNAGRSRSGLHPVTQPPYRLNYGHTELSAQPGDKYLQRIRIAIEPLSVDMFRQFVMGNDFPMMVHQVREDSKFVACQLYKTSVDAHLHCSSVKCDRAALKLVASLSGSPTNQRADAGQYLFSPERFRHVVIGAAINALNFFVPAPPCCEDQHWNQNAGLPPPLQNAESIHSGKPEIENDCIIRFCLTEELRSFTIGGAIDGIARILEGGCELAAQRPFIFYDQYSQALSPVQM